MRNNSDKKVKLTANILFSGIGCQERGFQDSGVFDIEVLNTSDINKESVLSYAAIHCGLTKEVVETYDSYPTREEMAQYLSDINLGYEPEKNKKFDWFKLIKKKTKDLEKYWLACKLAHNLGDISRIEELPYADFWTCSFPCTDISIAGKMKGLNPDSGTRSSLLWENMRLLKRAKDTNTLPKYIMVENVKNLVSKKFIDEFNDLLAIFDELGFNSYYKVLNGKDCGVPQNRERIFVIGIRKDIDNGTFTFPLPFDTGVRLKDILEETVDEKYYLSEKMTEKMTLNLSNQGKRFIDIVGHSGSGGQKGYIHTVNGGIGALSATDYKQPKQILDVAELHQVAQLYGTEKEPNPQAGRIYNAEGISPTLDTCSGGNRMPKIIQVGQVSNEGSQAGKVYSPEGVSQTICACTHGYAIGNIIDKLRVRKLTPRECFTLMGFSFDDCDKARNIGISSTNLYKQAGNGIITNCCSLLAEHLYKAQYDSEFVCTDERMQENFQIPQTD